RLLLGLVLLAAVGCARAPSPKAASGTIDLRSSSVASGTVFLDGDWELYWQREADGHPDRYHPSVQWGGARLPDGRVLPGQGWATYRVHVLVPDALKQSPRRLAVACDGANTAFRIVVSSDSGQLLGDPLEVGVVGANAAVSRGAYQAGSLEFVAG